MLIVFCDGVRSKANGNRAALLRITKEWTATALSRRIRKCRNRQMYVFPLCIFCGIPIGFWWMFQVQSKWQQGGIAQENKGMDSYGIVKTDKEMQNPSQAQGAWQQGAKPVDKSGMDSYGIIKTNEQ